MPKKRGLIAGDDPDKGKKKSQTSDDSEDGSAGGGGCRDGGGGGGDELADLRDEQGSWLVDDDEKELNGPPKNFEGALRWASDSATGDALVQLIGALRLPFSPYTYGGAGPGAESKKWFVDNRGMLEKRSKTFVSAVIETYDREQQDRVRAAKKKGSTAEHHRQCRQRYVERAELDRETFIGSDISSDIVNLGNIDHVFAMITPVNQYVLGGNHGARPVNPNWENVWTKKQGPTPPVVFKVKVTGAPRPTPSIPANRTYFSAHTRVTCAVVEPVTLRYRPPPSLPQAALAESKIKPITIPALVTMSFEQPFYHRSDIGTVVPFEWKAFMKFTPTIATPGGTSLMRLSDYNDASVDEMGTKFCPGLFEGKTHSFQYDSPFQQDIGQLQLLVPETRRYRTLLKRHAEFTHVFHSVLPIWNLIAEYQLLP